MRLEEKEINIFKIALNTILLLVEQIHDWLTFSLLEEDLMRDEIKYLFDLYETCLL